MWIILLSGSKATLFLLSMELILLSGRQSLEHMLFLMVLISSQFNKLVVQLIILFRLIAQIVQDMLRKLVQLNKQPKVNWILTLVLTQPLCQLLQLRTQLHQLFVNTYSPLTFLVSNFLAIQLLLKHSVQHHAKTISWALSKMFRQSTKMITILSQHHGRSN